MMEVCKKLGLQLLGFCMSIIAEHFEPWSCWDQLRKFQRGDCKYGDDCKYPHDVRGRWKRNICPQEADMAWNMCFGWFTGCCLLMFCFVWCCQTTTWWCVRQNIALLSKYYNSTCFATLWWMFAGRLWLKFNLYLSWFKRFWFFVTMAAASLLLLPIEAKQNLTLYVGMMGCKYAKLQGGEGVRPMANCARWGLKVTPVEAGT